MNSSLAKAAAFGELLSFWDDREANSSVKIDHSQWQEILDVYLDNAAADGVNRFDYAGLSTEDKQKLSAYLDYLQRMEPRQLSADEQMAYWINMYNATTVLVIVDQEAGLSSIRQIRSSFLSRGPWKLKLLTIARQELSLDDIEHGILRPIWRDPRIHYAVNCASIGCPNLLKTAFTGDNLESLLEQAAKDYINHPRGVSVDGESLRLSSIFDWYAEDFGSGFSELLEHLQKYAESPLKESLQEFTSADYDYDWDLNGPK
ncbi:MAG: DUF547 domain-containing protein [Acidiferrobacterales bacterium]|nr:DUF547 domain-containing protein [Acidiferrobacterales bacterium]